MKCWLGHTRMKNMSGETKVVSVGGRFLDGNFIAEKKSVQSHVCKDCGVHFSTIKKLDAHTMDVMKPKEEPMKIRFGDFMPPPFIGHVEYRGKKKGKRK